jgi:large subunit ribosomal protein L7Ae
LTVGVLQARLGAVVRKKTATCLAVTEVRQEDSSELATICKSVKLNYNDEADRFRRTWGGGIMGIKNRARMDKIRRMLAADAAKKAAQ